VTISVKKAKALPRTLPPDSPQRSAPSTAGDWRADYDLIKELRADRTAPVDFFGSEALPARPPAVTEAVFRFQTLVALMLSSQTKDPAVGAAIQRLREGMKHGLCLEGIEATPQDTIRDLLYGVGFHNNKAKFLKCTAVVLREQHGGLVPGNFDDLVKLPGVGPKMALIVLNVAFDTVVGVSIDTHLHRMCAQLGWVKGAKSPEDSRKGLESWLPREHWHEVNLIWVGMGQEIQTEKRKLLGKALACSKPKEAVRLLKRLGMDVTKQGKADGVSLP